MTVRERFGGRHGWRGAESDPHDALCGSVGIGGYILEVGGAGGTLVQQRSGLTDEDTASLERALTEEDSSDAKEEGAAAAAAGVVDDASEVTAKIERTVALGKGLAEGGAQPRAVSAGGRHPARSANGSTGRGGSKKPCIWPAPW